MRNSKSKSRIVDIFNNKYYLFIVSSFLFFCCLAFGFAVNLVEADSLRTQARRNLISEIDNSSESIRFLSSLSVFQNAMIFNSSTSIEGVLNEYIQKIGRENIIASVVTDKENNIFATGFCQSRECIKSNALPGSWIRRALKEIFNSDRRDNLNDLQVTKINVDFKSIAIGMRIFDNKLNSIGKIFVFFDEEKLLDKLLGGEIQKKGLFSIRNDRSQKYNLALDNDHLIKLAAYLFGKQLTLFFVFSLVITLISSTIIFFLSQKLLIPFVSLSKALDKVASGKNERIRIDKNIINSPLVKLSNDLNDVIDRLVTSQESIKKMESQAAIARTTQTIAHDVRKPFSLLKVIIDTAEGISDPNEVKSFFKNSLPEVQQAIASVNGMISDVLEIGSESQPISEPTNLETLIESTLLQCVRIYPNCEFKINYHLQQKSSASACATLP